ncbi:MAG: hypothetical protein ACJ04Q_04995 [Flavobacteriales bacterium]
MKQLFESLYFAKDEEEIQEIIKKNISIFDDDNWKPLGQNKSNYGVVKNQQSNPIAALIEKATNSIDAILTKQCLEKGIDPTSEQAPKSMDEAIEIFYPQNNWDLTTNRKAQSEEIQIIADGKGPRNQKNQYPTSVIIYDNGEGQHPENFENSFLSLLRGNKNNIHFVQGKYNMGGSGAIVFCGKKRYQLIASKRYDKTGDFGFTLIREHPKKETDQAKETWYEYLLIDGKIPSFQSDKLELGLENRKFETGTIIKMYSYQFPKGYSGFAQDLNQSINEFLFSPALPILTKDTALRYPNNKVLVNDLYGLKRRLHKETGDYIDQHFSEDYEDELFGKMKVSCFVFNIKVKDFDLKKTKDEIQRRYFKNGMNVMFSMNGQVHGFYTSEFITRSLKLNLLKSHLLIHVDCTEMKYDFRKELFMASRDRLKDGEETQQLRHYLASKLSAIDGRLHEIQKLRRQAVNVDTSSNTNQLMKNFTKNLPLNSDLMKLLGDTFKLDLKKDKKTKGKEEKRPNKEREEVPFIPQRFPSQFKINSKVKGDTEVAKIPINGEKTISFNTDCEDEYFDRTEEPGELKIGVLRIKPNETDGGKAPGTPKEITDIFNVNKSSPNKGTIRISLNPKGELKVGDAVQLKVSLTAPGGDFDEIFWVKIADPIQPKEKAPKPEDDNEPLGLPRMVFAYQDKEGKGENAVSWEDVGVATSIDIDYKTVMVPEAEGDNLNGIFINMDSTVLKNFKSKYQNPNEEQIELSNRKYYTAVYFHTLFLYTITKNRGYQIKQKVEDQDRYDDVDVAQYLKDLFDHYYSTFILNFGGMEEMMQGLGD